MLFLHSTATLYVAVTVSEVSSTVSGQAGFQPDFVSGITPSRRRQLLNGAAGHDSQPELAVQILSLISTVPDAFPPERRLQ